MGIKGTVRRSTDGDFIHANVDIDLIITEEVNMTKSLSCTGSYTRLPVGLAGACETCVISRMNGGHIGIKFLFGSTLFFFPKFFSCCGLYYFSSPMTFWKLKS